MFAAASRRQPSSSGGRIISACRREKRWRSSSRWDLWWPDQEYKIMDGTDILAREAATYSFLPISTAGCSAWRINRFLLLNSYCGCGRWDLEKTSTATTGVWSNITTCVWPCTSYSSSISLSKSPAFSSWFIQSRFLPFIITLLMMRWTIWAILLVEKYTALLLYILNVVYSRPGVNYIVWILTWAFNHFPNHLFFLCGRRV